MAKRKTKSTKAAESDSAYFLKLVLYLIMGSLWVKITYADAGQLPLPVGLVIGVIFASHEHFKIDRKIEYAILLAAALIGFWLPLGIFINA